MTTTTGRPGSTQQDGVPGTGAPDLVLPLQEATDPRFAGRKAATLAVLAAAGFPVPPGVVLSTTALRRAAAAAGAQPDPGGVRVPDDVGAALASAVAGWGDVPLAVRSSAVDEDLAEASYAGLYTTVLDVRGTAELLDAVRRCWESASSAGVTTYRQAREERPRPGIAVLVQPMLRPVAAGVAFTADPVTGARDVVVIDAVPGVAEALVSGEQKPECWTVRSSGPELSGPRPDAAETVLTPAVAAAVADLARRVESHRGGRPQDVEWAAVGDRVWLLQARPVTGLPGLPDRSPTPIEVPVEVPEGFWMREATHSALPWTRMTREVLASRNPGLRQWVVDTGLLFDTAEVRDVNGYEYLRIVPLGGRKPPKLPAWVLPIAFRVVPAVRRRNRQAAAAARDDLPMRLVRRWSEQWRPQLTERMAALRGVDLPALDDAALQEHLQATLDLAAEGHLVHFRLHGALMMVLGDLAAACEELLGWSGDRWLDLVSGTSATSTAPGRALARLATTVAARPDLHRLITDGAPSEVVLAADPQFAAEFADYQREFGCRALCYELAEEKLDERPDLVLGLLRDQLATGYDPARHDEPLARRRRAAADEARERLAGRTPADRDRFESVLRRALAAYQAREDNEFSTMSAPLALVRRAVLEGGSRLASRGLLERPDHVFHLEPGELLMSLREGTDRRALVTRRRGERAWVLTHPGPASYGRPPSGPPPLSALPAASRRAMQRFLWLFDQLLGTANGERFPAGPAAGGVRGIPASAGTYTGPVRVIRTEAEFDRLRSGDVLVCPVTSPVWSVLFPLIGALVTDTGGALSHQAIIAREFDVPAVVATGDGTSRLRDGQLVTVDGGTGTVRVLS
jgi:phosphohistidine swiveling domain-containing protein